MNNPETTFSHNPPTTINPLVRKSAGNVAFFRKDFSQKAMVAFFVVLVVIQVINIRHTLPILWIIFASVTALLFFNNLSRLSKSWARFPVAVFRRKLFQQALVIRIVVVIFMYFFFTYMTDQPFEFSAGDSHFYNGQGFVLSDYILDGNFDFFNKLSFLDVSDMGYPIFLGFIYVICFKSILMARIITCLVSAWTCLIIYDLAKRNFDEQVARIAGIMMLLMPNLIYYCGLTLKETVMVFLAVATINFADKVLRLKRIKSKDFLFLVMSGALLFFFRTVLALAIIMAIGTTIVIASGRVSNTGRRVFLGFWVVIGVIAIFSTSLGAAIDKLIANIDQNQESQMQLFSSKKNSNAFAKYGTKAIFLPMILLVPFPTFVDTQQDNAEMISGAMYTRNIYAFFVIVALIFLYKRKLLRKHALIITPLSFYLLILGSSGFALSERFHLPAIPFLVILASYGITQMDKKSTRYYVPYLVLVSIVIIGWNWFKLAGRGF